MGVWSLQEHGQPLPGRFRKASGIRPRRPRATGSPSVPCSPSPTPVAPPPPASTCYCCWGSSRPLGGTGCRQRARVPGRTSPRLALGGQWRGGLSGQLLAQVQDRLRGTFIPGAPAEPGLGRKPSCRGCAPRGQARPSVRGLITGRKLSRSSRADFPLFILHRAVHFVQPSLALRGSA